MVNLAQKEKDLDGVIFTPLKTISVTDGNILHGMKIFDFLPNQYSMEVTPL